MIAVYVDWMRIAGIPLELGGWILFWTVIFRVAGRP